MIIRQTALAAALLVSVAAHAELPVGLAFRQLPDSAAVKKDVAADPKAIGYIDKSAVDGSVKAALTLD